jgi:hypothetical protein
MFQMGGVTFDLTNSETLKGVNLKLSGSIQQHKDGEEVTMKNDTDKPQSISQIFAAKGT